MYEITDQRVKYFIKEVSILGKVTPLEKTNKALRLVLSEMTKEKGYERHDGRDYYVHPIAVAQAALDFQLFSSRVVSENKKDADDLLATCLLHDAMEDIPFIDEAYLIKEFGEDIYKYVFNVTKIENEPTDEYLKRVESESISAVVKILDRFHNISTLSKSTNEHRKRQLEETKKYYLPLTKKLRRIYFEDYHFYWQARYMITSILNEVERSFDS